MPRPIDAATRLQITTLREAGNTYSQIAEQLGVHHDTVMRAIKRHDRVEAAREARKIATRDSVLERMTTIMEHADKPIDSIAAAKLLAMMQGWLTPEQGRASMVNVNVLGNNVDIRALENEYTTITGRVLNTTDTHSDDDNNAYGRQVVDNTPDTAPNCEDKGGGSPPGDESDTK